MSIRDKLSHAVILPPSRIFSVGEEVELGHLDKCVVLEVAPGGRSGLYLLECTHKHRDGVDVKQLCEPWYRIFKKGHRASSAALSNVSTPDNLRFVRLSSQVDSMLHRVERPVCLL